MEKDEIEIEIKSIIESRFGIDVESHGMDSNLSYDMDMDSLDVVEFIMEVEKDINIRIPDEKAEAFKTPMDVVNYIYEHKDDIGKEV